MGRNPGIPAARGAQPGRRRPRRRGGAPASGRDIRRTHVGGGGRRGGERRAEGRAAARGCAARASARAGRAGGHRRYNTPGMYRYVQVWGRRTHCSSCVDRGMGGVAEGIGAGWMFEEYRCIRTMYAGSAVGSVRGVFRGSATGGRTVRLEGRGKVRARSGRHPEILILCHMAPRGPM